jgi:glycosyltransferase involved in cell wall biosynthesis
MDAMQTKRKNILIFGHSYLAPFTDVSNQYTHLFDKKNYEVTVAYLTGEPSAAVHQAHVAEHVIFLNSPKKSVRGLKLVAIRQMWQLCREKNFQIVICHRYKPTYIMLLISKFHKIPALFSVMHELGTIKNLARKIFFALFAPKNMIFAGVSDAVRNDMRRDIWRVPQAQVVTLHNHIDIKSTESQQLSRHDARQALHLSADAFIFGQLGRLVKNKDQSTLIKAFALIKSQCPNAKLVIAGRGQLENTLKQLIRTLGLQNDVILTGFVEKGFQYLKAFDVYISSSVQEAFGRVLLEAMIARIPIIATQVDGVPEVIGDAGVLIAAKNPEALATVMLKAYQTAREELELSGKKAYERALNCFSVQQFNENFWRLPVLCHKEHV